MTVTLRSVGLYHKDADYEVVSRNGLARAEKRAHIELCRRNFLKIAQGDVTRAVSAYQKDELLIPGTMELYRLQDFRRCVIALEGSPARDLVWEAYDERTHTFPCLVPNPEVISPGCLADQLEEVARKCMYLEEDRHG
jgi:hypothetical protein